MSYSSNEHFSQVCILCKKEKFLVKHFYCSVECHNKDWPVHKKMHEIYRSAIRKKKVQQK